MISVGEIERNFHFINQDQLAVLLEIHNLVSEISPGASAEIRRYGIVYYDASRGGPVRAGICQSLIKGGHIRLAFIHGAFLPDPYHLLQGETFPKRYVRINEFDTAPWEAMKALIAAHSLLDPAQLAVNKID
jgi:hypothetical protein